MTRPAYALALLMACLLLSACERSFKQSYDDGVPQFDAQSLVGLRAAGSLYPDQRVSETVDGCRLTTATTDTPAYLFTTRFRDCPDAPKQYAQVTLRRKSDGQESEALDLTADREKFFEHTLRIADVDGEEPPDLVMLSCSGAEQPAQCEWSWLYRQMPGHKHFGNFLAVGHQRLWLNAHYFVTESGSAAVGLPSVADDLNRSVTRESFLGPGHLTRQVYLRHPPRRPDALDLPGMPDENTVTWHHGLLVYADLVPATGACTLYYPKPPDGTIHTLSPVPESLQRLCAAEFKP